jgi:hypothetical protein
MIFLFDHNIMNPSIEIFGSHSKLTELSHNDSAQLKKSGIQSPDLSKLKIVREHTAKCGSKTIFYR